MSDQNDTQPEKQQPSADTLAGAAAEHIMQFFKYDHLPPALQEVSRPFAELAKSIVGLPAWEDAEGKAPAPMNLPRNPERTVALRKLLEAKDAAVRAFIAK